MTSQAENETSLARPESGRASTLRTQKVLTLGQLYRDRADCENAFDELKNHWGWGGFTTQDLKRCRLLAANVALIYNWWSLFVRLADPDHQGEQSVGSSASAEIFPIWRSQPPFHCHLTVARRARGPAPL